MFIVGSGVEVCHTLEVWHTCAHPPPFCPKSLFGKKIAPYICSMFFKKRKNMNDNKNAMNENADNLSQNEEMDEISNILNSDDSRAGTELPESNNDEVEQLQGEIAELKDKHLRLIAEFDNFRRRTAKERVELTQTAGKDILQSLLVVLDDVNRAEKQMETTDDIAVLKEGISLVFNKFKAIMQSKGLKEMEAHNTEFNADLHEAITEIPAPNNKMVGKVMDVVEQGYYLNDKLIRHAKVVVGK
jgi:molecular chaperone GrpE